MANKRAKTKNTITIFGKTIPNSAFVGILVLFALVAFLGYNLVANELDRRKFADIEKTVDTLVSRINEEFEPMTFNDSSRCYKASRKLGPEPTLCEYSKTAYVDDVNASNIFSFSLRQSDILVDGEEAFGKLFFRSATGNNDCRLEYDDSSSSLVFKCLEYARRNYYTSTD